MPDEPRPPALACVDIEWTGNDWRLVAVFEDNSWQFVSGPSFTSEAQARDAVITVWPRLQRVYERLGSDISDTP